MIKKLMLLTLFLQRNIKDLKKVLYSKWEQK